MPRRKHDFYETPPHYVAALLENIDVKDRTVYEPCVGTRCIAGPLQDAGATVLTNDIDRKWRADFHYDAASLEAWDFDPPDWVITNPPFNQWLPIAKQALKHTDNVALLARLSILEPTEDRELFWKLHPPTGLIVLPRYSFRCNDEGRRQTDSVTCCWVIWEDGKEPCLTVEGRP